MNEVVRYFILSQFWLLAISLLNTLAKPRRNVGLGKVSPSETGKSIGSVSQLVSKGYKVVFRNISRVVGRKEQTVCHCTELRLPTCLPPP